MTTLMTLLVIILVGGLSGLAAAGTFELLRFLFNTRARDEIRTRGLLGAFKHHLAMH
jgi:hypothetical protein